MPYDTQAQKRAGLCRVCMSPVEPGKTYCSVHLAKMRAYMQRRGAARAASNTCRDCGAPAAKGRTYCAEHLAIRATRRRARPRQGVTKAERVAMLAAQGGRCAICGSTDPGAGRDWHVDHNHATGQIRDLLCHHCNTGLGDFRDRPDLLRAAAAYLERHASVGTFGQTAKVA